MHNRTAAALSLLTAHLPANNPSTEIYVHGISDVADYAHRAEEEGCTPAAYALNPARCFQVTPELEGACVDVTGRGMASDERITLREILKAEAAAAGFRFYSSRSVDPATGWDLPNMVFTLR